MKYSTWIGLVGVTLLIIACFLPWYELPWKAYTVTGMEAGTFGKPAYLHFICAGVFLILGFVPRIWAKQWNVFIAAINCAWMARNFFALAICSAGECPRRQFGIWLLVVSSLMMLFASLFPDIKIPREKTNNIR